MSDHDDDAVLNEEAPEEEHAVGYGKPPLHSRWRPGQSGNPSGRKKKPRCFADDLEAEVNQRITLTEGGRKITVTKMRAIVKSLLTNTIKGKVGTTRLLLEQLEKHGLTATPPEQEDEQYELTEEFLTALIDKATKLRRNRISDRLRAEREATEDEGGADEVGGHRG